MAQAAAHAQGHLMLEGAPAAAGPIKAPAGRGRAGARWCEGLPRLQGQLVTLRELHPSDAPALASLLTTAEVVRHLAPPPSSVEAFERFIGWTFEQRALGRFACFGVTIGNFDTAVGLFQLHLHEARAPSAEWGFAIASPFWGTGVFQSGARLMMDFAFDVVGVRRLEARTAMGNRRAHGALKKIGAVAEGLLRNACRDAEGDSDQILWTILEDDRRGIHGDRSNSATPATAQPLN